MHKKHLVCYALIVLGIFIVVHKILTAGSAVLPSNPGTDGTGGSIGSITSPDLRTGTTQGSVNKMYVPWMRRKLGITAF